MTDTVLSFSHSDLEQQFQLDWYRGSLKQIRISLGLAILLLLCFAGLDEHYFPPEQLNQVFWFRWLVLLPLGVACLATTFLRVPGRYVFYLMTFSFSLMTGFFAVLAPAMDQQALFYLMPQLVQLALFQLVLLRTPFLIAVAASAFALAMTAIALNQMALAPHQHISVLGGFIAIHVILLFTAYQRERDQRSLFISEQQLRQSLLEQERIQVQRSAWYQNLARFLRHELSNQLLGVRTSLQLIERVTDERKEYIGRAKRSLERMQLMLNETSDATSIEDALATGEREVFDLSLLVADCAAEFMDQYPNHFFDLQLESDISLQGQPFRISQLLDKLVSNAVRYSQPRHPIVIRLGRDSHSIRLSVANRGQALPQDREHLFELWATSASGTAERRLGLGLYVAARIARAHSGQIHAEPLTDPDGATFIVTLPSTDRS